jgi:hypothetical protein
MTDLFNGQDTPPNNNQNQPDLATLLAGIKNESGAQKYNSVEDALRGSAHAQAYIQELKTKLEAEAAEKARLTAELSKASNIDDVVSKLASQLQSSKTQDNPPKVEGLNEDAVKGLISGYLDQQKQQDAAKANLDVVQSAMSSKYGDKAQEVIHAKAKELGVTPEYLGQMASTSPQIILQLFGVTASTQKGTSVSTSSVNLPPINNGPKERVKAPDYSLLGGPKATLANQIDFLKKIREEVYRDFNVEGDMRNY